MYNSLSTSGKALAKNYKDLLDSKSSQYGFHKKAVQEAELQSATDAAAREAKNTVARDQFISKLTSTYLKDGRTYAQMDGNGVANGELDSMLKKYGLFRNDGYSISEVGAASIMNQLGYSQPSLQTREYMLQYMKQIGFSNGGIAETLHKVPGMNGDDGETGRRNIYP